MGGVEVDITEDPTDDTNEGLDVTLKVKEPRRFTGGIHTLVGNNDGSLMVTFKTPNAFGRGEKLSLDYTHGMVKSKTHTISFTKPINADPDKWFTAAGFTLTTTDHGVAMAKHPEALALDLLFQLMVGSTQFIG